MVSFIEAPLKPVLLVFSGWDQSPSAPQRWWPDPLALRTRVKAPPGVGYPVAASFLRVKLNRTTAGSAVPGAEQSSREG